MTLPQPASAEIKILIIDDEEIIINLLTSVLSFSGYTTSCAGNGREGLDRLAKNDIDLVISGISMPKMDGIQLLGEIRQHYSDIGVILISGYPGNYHPEDLMNAGALGLLGKPFSINELLTKVIMGLQEKPHAIATGGQARS